MENYEEIDTGAVDYVHDKIILYWDTERQILTDDAYTDFNLANVSAEIASFVPLIQKRGFDVSKHGEIIHDSRREETVRDMVALIKDIYHMTLAAMKW